MKIVKIFGIVVAAHAMVFMFVFAVPGCRSTGKQKSAAAPATSTDASPFASPVTSAEAPAATESAPSAAPDTSLPSIRFSPTRPGSSESAVVATPAPAAAASTPGSTHIVSKGDNPWSIAKKHGIPVKELLAANHLRSDSTLKLGQQLIVPGKAGASSAPAPAAPAPSAAPAASTATTTYAVKSGDTLATIARRHGTTVAALKMQNKLKSDALHLGQELKVPAGASASASAAPAAPAPAAATSAGSGSGRPALTHVIKTGETLGSIARKYQIKVGELATANNIADPTKIRVGQELKLPGWQTPAAAKAAAVSPASPAPAVVAAPVAEPAPAPVFTPVSPVSPVSAEPVSPIFGTPAVDSGSPVAAPVPADAPIIAIENAPVRE